MEAGIRGRRTRSIEDESASIVRFSRKWICKKVRRNFALFFNDFRQSEGFGALDKPFLPRVRSRSTAAILIAAVAGGSK